MKRRAVSLALGVLTTLGGGCTDRPLPGSDDEVGEISEVGDDGTTGSTTEGPSESESDSTTTDDSTDDSTTDDSTTDDSTTDSTTDESCGTPEVVEDLTIDADTPPEDLACLRQVNDRLLIKEVDWTNLSYLPALERVGWLDLYDNQSLVSLTGTSLAEIDDLTLNSLPALTSTAGLEQLVKLEHLYVSGLPASAMIDLPIGLPTVGIDAYTINLDLLANLQPQPSGPTFWVSAGSSVEDLGGLSSCCAMPELDLYLWDTPLTNLASLQGITTMYGLHVGGAENLVDLTGLEQLESIGTLEISGSKCDLMPGWTPIPLTGLTGLEGVSTIGSLELRFLFDFQTLGALPANATVTSLELRNLSLLTYAEANNWAAQLGVENSWICGLAGDADFCLTREEGGICPQ